MGFQLPKKLTWKIVDVELGCFVGASHYVELSRQSYVRLGSLKEYKYGHNVITFSHKMLNLTIAIFGKC